MNNDNQKLKCNIETIKKEIDSEISKLKSIIKEKDTELESKEEIIKQLKASTLNSIVTLLFI